MFWLKLSKSVLIFPAMLINFNVGYVVAQCTVKNPSTLAYGRTHSTNLYFFIYSEFLSPTYLLRWAINGKNIDLNLHFFMFNYVTCGEVS